MKYIYCALLFFGSISFVSAQGGLPESFFDGKSVVMISVDPGSRPVMTWQQLADSVHYHFFFTIGRFSNSILFVCLFV
jgi:hypothetical protein